MFALKVENLSKQYRLGQVGTGTLSHDLRRWWHLVRGKPDPYLKVGEVNDRARIGSSQYVWALQDINFEVEQGEVLGIIGKNGAGKSTLLKILSKVTGPTTGEIWGNGRVASLLEVGTGFHPELTGRENIYLNGTILGMTKAEVKKKLDEIVDFAGVERYLDTPVKRFSTGMIVRLGFAVAAHLEPEILIVDEVLAVGDAEFQKKAVGKMQEVSQGQGRTVLFVSHNMVSITKLCSRAILLENGKIAHRGMAEDTVEEYLSRVSTKDELNDWENIHREGNGKVRLIGFKTYTNPLDKTLPPKTGKDIYFEFTFDREIKEGVLFDFRIDDLAKYKLAWFSTRLKMFAINGNQVTFKIPKCPFLHGKYSITTCAYLNGVKADWIKNQLFFEISEGAFYDGYTGKVPDKQGPIHIDFGVF